MKFREHFRTNFNIRLQIANKGTELSEILESNLLKDFKSETSFLKFN